ncbi:MAG: protein O-mannosyl-transferase family [Anaerolineae bacterium]
MKHTLKRAWAGLEWSNPAHAGLLQKILLWLATFTVYAATTARDVLPADSGEFQLVAAGWGIAHPPGYPLYTVVGALWVRLLPFGSVPFRLNILSAVLAATTIVLIASAVELWSKAGRIPANIARAGGLSAALALGLSATFWAQATTANIRMPTMLFVAWGYLALARFRAAEEDGKRQRRALIGLALALGLGVGHHPSLAFVALGWALYVLLLSPRLLRQPGRWIAAAGVAVLAWGLPQLYLPLRDSMAGVPLAPGDLTSWSGFWDHVLARGFGGDMLAFTSRIDLAVRLPLLPTLFRMQFPPLILATIGGGWLLLLRRRTRLAVTLLLSWAVQTFITITYRAPQTIEYLMPAYAPMALTLGLTVAMLRAPTRHTTRTQRRVSQGLILLSLAVLLWQLPHHAPSFIELANDTSVRARLMPLLDAAGENATILADWRWATPLRVLQQTEGRASTTDVTYVYPEADVPYEQVWRSRAVEIVESPGSPPLYTTHSFAWSEWTYAPVGGGYRLYKRPLEQLPPELAYTVQEAQLGSVRLLGYRWMGTVAPGETVELQLAWQATASQEPEPSFTARLWDEEEKLLNASDQRLGTSTTVGEVRFTQLTLQLPIDRCSAKVYPTLGAYVVVDNAIQDLGSLSLPPLTSDCRYPRLPVERIWPGVVLWGGPFLCGIDYDTRAQGPTVAHMHWCGPGDELIVASGNAQATVARLDLGQCQTVRLSVSGGEPPKLQFSRPTGSPARLLALPLPRPRSQERYLPFGDKMVLVDVRPNVLRATETSATILTFRWRTASSLRDDYAVSARLLDGDRNWLGIHDMQPGAGAIPTLKWVVRDSLIRDPHVFLGLSEPPAYISLVVYERFRLTPLRSAFGDVATYRLPPDLTRDTMAASGLYIVKEALNDRSTTD